MKPLALTLFIGLGGLTCVTPAFAQARPPGPTLCSVCKAAPAPLIGLGVPGALAIGEVLLGARLLRRSNVRKKNMQIA